MGNQDNSKYAFKSIPRTKESLSKLSRIYNKNFKIIMDFSNPKKRLNAIKREDILSKIEFRLRTDMNTLIPCSCKLSGSVDCFSCTGYYVKVPKDQRKNYWNKRYEMVDVGMGEKCILSTYSKINKFKEVV